MLFLIAMSVKAPSILHIAVLARRLITSSALNIPIIEALRIREVSLDDHCRFSIKELQYHKGALLVANTVHMLSIHYLN